MKQKFPFWLKAGFLLFSVSVVGSTIAVFSKADFDLGTKERCEELYLKINTPFSESSGEGAATEEERNEFDNHCSKFLKGSAPSDIPAKACDSLAKGSE